MPFDSTLGSTITEAAHEYDAQITSSVLVSGGGTATDGQNVATWVDQGSVGTNATQSSASARPVLDSDGINGHPAIQSAAGDFFNIADYAIARNLSGYTFATVLKYVDSASLQGIIQLPNASGGNRITIYKDSSDNIYIIQNAPDATDKSVYTNDAMTNGNIYRLIVKTDFAGNSTKLFLNGTEVHSASLSGGVNTSNTDAIEPVGLFASNPYGGSTNLSAFGHVLWYKYALSDVNVAALDSALEDYWAEDVGGETHYGEAAIDAASTVTATGSLTKGAIASIDAVSTTTAAGSLTKGASATVDSSATVTASAGLTASASGSVDATSSVTASATRTLGIAASISATSSATAAAVRTLGAAASVDSQSDVTAAGSTTLSAAASIDAQSSVTASASGDAQISAEITAESTVTAVVGLKASLSSAVNSVSTVSASASVTRGASASITSVSSIAASGALTASGVATIAAAATVTVSAEVESGTNTARLSLGTDKRTTSFTKERTSAFETDKRTRSF